MRFSLVIAGAALLVIAAGATGQQKTEPPTSPNPGNKTETGETRTADRLPSVVRPRTPGLVRTSKEIDEYKRAAEQGNVETQFDLAVIFATGDGVAKDVGEAIKWYTRAAEQGNAKAQCDLASIYSHGEEIPANQQEAFKWYTRAAEQGDANGQFNLGCCYLVGEGVAKDAKQGLKWLTRAAEQGNPVMQWSLGAQYQQAKVEMPGNAQEAAKWYRFAAEQGLSVAQSSLGNLYSKGDGVPQDYMLAYFWLNVSTAPASPLTIDGEQPAPGVQNAAAVANEKFQTLARDLRDSIAKLMTPAQIAEAQRLSREFKPKKWHGLDQPADVAGAIEADFSGSGFFITQDGYFVTNHHVVDGARRVRVRTANGIYSATVVRQDAANDLALLKIQGDFSAIHIRGSTDIHPSDRVFTVGYPNPSLQGITPKFSSGEVAALTGPRDEPRFFQISVPVQPGNSGGPLVDSSGSVVGVIVGQLDKANALRVSGQLPENVNYAIKGTLLLTLLESVPGLKDKLQPHASTPLADTATITGLIEKATGMVLVDR